MVSKDSYQEYRQVAEEVARQAGDTIRKAFHAPKRVEEKSSIQDLVTETDRSVELLIKKLIGQHYPTHHFIGEETHVCDGVPEGPTWIVDPIDGTTNFVHGMPMLCVSIGLCIERQPVAGAIYNPLTDELFSAALGHGATLDGNSISVSKLSKSLKTSLIITEFTTKEEAEYTAGDAVKLMQRVQSVRMHGSAALDLCYTACGRADGYVQRGIKCWDICAGIVIVREAGGFVTDYKGKEHFDLCNGHIIATSCPAVTHEIIGVLQ